MDEETRTRMALQEDIWTVHEEEMFKDMVAVACPASASKEDMQSEEDEPFKAAKIRLDRILRVYGYVFADV
jgi:hypothetical protein